MLYKREGHGCIMVGLALSDYWLPGNEMKRISKELGCSHRIDCGDGSGLGFEQASAGLTGCIRQNITWCIPDNSQLYAFATGYGRLHVTRKLPNSSNQSETK